jgi:hypothetical protein
MLNSGVVGDGDQILRRARVAERIFDVTARVGDGPGVEIKDQCC